MIHHSHTILLQLWSRWSGTHKWSTESNFTWPITIFKTNSNKNCNTRTVVFQKLSYNMNIWILYEWIGPHGLKHQNNILDVFRAFYCIGLPHVTVIPASQLNVTPRFHMLLALPGQTQIKRGREVFFKGSMWMVGRDSNLSFLARKLDEERAYSSSDSRPLKLRKHLNAKSRMLCWTRVGIGTKYPLIFLKILSRWSKPLLFQWQVEVATD